MPATEETYRSQQTLNIVFALTSIGMTLVIIWMIAADHLRPWKKVQREFQKIETAKLKAAKEAKEKQLKATKKAELAELDKKIKAAEKTAADNAREIAELQRQIDQSKGKYELLDTQKKFLKAEIDSQKSFYDLAIEAGNRAEAREILNVVIAQLQERYDSIVLEFEAASETLRKQEALLAEKRGNIGELIKARESLQREVKLAADTYDRKEREYGEGSFKNRLLAFIRAFPGMDMAAPPTKIQQISLPDLKINYNFKEVPRYDRCTTCHLGIDRPGYDVDAAGKPMPAVYASHPHLKDGASYINPKTGQPEPAGLYLDSNGPHPINKFGCTICHSGQGSGTTFTYASHTPNDPKQRHEWEEKYHWHEIHHWDFPMLPSRFVESSCLKCHHQVTDIPQASKVQAGYQRIAKYGCTGCHTIGGEGSFGPDLTDNRPVGPSLRHVASKTNAEWLAKWIANPHAFRPDSRMPRFYGLTNNDSPEDWPKNFAEIYAMTHYLLAKSTPPPGFEDPPVSGDPARGKETFLQKGCLACHSHRPYEPSDVPPSLTGPTNRDHGPVFPKTREDVPAPIKADYGVTVENSFAPETFPESVRTYAKAEHGPNLGNIAAKFAADKEQGFKWLANWLKAPEAYHPKTLMPNLQLTWQESADIASWLLSVPGDWPVDVNLAPLESEEVGRSLDELVRLYKRKTEPASKVESIVRGMSQDEKLMYLGERTIGRLGCFGCHNISGFENYKPIGTPLNGWGLKSPTKLDFGHIAEYLVERADDGVERESYYGEQLLEKTRIGFLYQKLHRPRSYDYKKTKEELKAWDDRLRMPQFAWADDPSAIEEVMTFVLGLTDERVDARYLPNYSPAKQALARGERLIERYNCKGCHVLQMPRFTIAAGTKLEEAMPELTTNVEASFANRASDYLELYAHLGVTKQGDAPPPLGPDDGQAITIEGMPIMTIPEDNLVYVQLWEPVTIRGYTFNVGDNVTLSTLPGKVLRTEADGGDFAWLFAADQSSKTGGQFADFWNRLPPPLIREGKKVQTPWLTRFLEDPYPIRPAANLRMPRFHYGKTAVEHSAMGGSGTSASLDLLTRQAKEETDAETRDLANYFAARDGAEFPYQDLPMREQAYLAKMQAAHPDYLSAGWQMLTKGACVQCHAIGPYKPTGGANVVNGPNLWQVADRFRPDYLYEWLAKPSRLLPYTAMPQNVPPPGAGAPAVPVVPSFEGKPAAMVGAMRDALLNYTTTIEQQLAGTAPATKPEADKDKAAGGSE